MKPRRFFAKDMRTALNMVREELGPEAMIYSQNNLEQGIEIIAGLGQELELKTSPGSKIIPSVTLPMHGHASDQIGFLHQELEQVKNLLENQVADLVWDKYKKANPLQATIIKKLNFLGFSLSLANQLAQEFSEESQKIDYQKAIQYVKQALSDMLLISPFNFQDAFGVYALIGSNGVGKSLTCIKWAMQAVLKWGQTGVVILSLDTKKIGALENLKIYGKILNIPVHAVHAGFELLEFIEKYRDNKKLILIDTPGLSAYPDSQNKDFFDILESLKDFSKNIFVIDVTQQKEIIESTINALKNNLKIEGVILTKLDFTKKIAPVLSLLIEKRLSFMGLSDGLSVPENLIQIKSDILIDQAFRVGPEMQGLEKESRFSEEFCKLRNKKDKV
ncbi:MAG: hypothetical protein ACKOAD_01655 [Gammaproteobacteria bacterium]